MDKEGEDEDLPSSPLPRNAVDPRAEHVCESSFPRLSEGNRESRWACHNVIYETPRGCLQHPTGTAGRGRAMAPTPEVSLTPPCDGIGKRVPPVDVRGRLLWTLFELQLFFIRTFSASFFRQMDVRLAVIIRLLRCLRLFGILGLFRVLRILIFRFRTLG